MGKKNKSYQLEMQTGVTVGECTFKSTFAREQHTTLSDEIEIFMLIKQPLTTRYILQYIHFVITSIIEIASLIYPRHHHVLASVIFVFRKNTGPREGI